MKKKIFLTLVMTFALALMFVCMASAEEFTHNGKVDLNATVTLASGDTVNLFDNEGNALIWFMNGAELQSIRADDERVKYKATYGFNVGNNAVGLVYAYEVSDMWIELESGKISKSSVVVLNMMDDDVKVNEATNNSYLDKPVNCIKTFMWANKILEYAYLRLDTAAIQQQAFNGCDKLKYVNLESLTELRQIGGTQTFGGSPLLFKDQVLDLSNTKLVALSGDGAFNGVKFADIKFPASITSINPWCLQNTGLTVFRFPQNVATINGSQFNDTKGLKEIYINNVTTKIHDRAFNNTALEKIYFVGTLSELNALLDNTGTGSNAPFWAVVGEDRANLISYADYKKLDDKSGKYVVYNYSYCEAYNEGNHNIVGSNPCVGVCSVCNDAIISHSNEADLSVSVEYAKGFAQIGTKITACQNKGCTYSESVEMLPLFTCQGFSISKLSDGISLGFLVNAQAIADYTDITGSTLIYGVFAAAQEKLGVNDIFDAKGNANENAITAEIKKTDFTAFDIKVTGFVTTEQKTALLALGAYVAVTKNGETVYSYVQSDVPENGAKYSFTSFDIELNK